MSFIFKMEGYYSNLKEILLSTNPSTESEVSFLTSSSISLKGRCFVIQIAALLLLEKTEEGEQNHTYTVLSKFTEADDALIILWNARGGDSPAIEVLEGEGGKVVKIGPQFVLGRFLQSPDVDKIVGVVRWVSIIHSTPLISLAYHHPFSNPPPPPFIFRKT